MPFRPLAALVLSLTLATPALGEGIAVIDAYARTASPAAKSGAAFLVLENTGATGDRLIAARSDAAARTELHTHRETGDGIMQMAEIEGGIPLPAGGMYQMKRGGDHVMLMGLTGPLEQGSEIVVILVFEQAGEIAVDVPVDNARAPDADAHAD